MSSTNRSNRVTNPDDFFRTPAACVDLILPHLPTAGSVLEPCAGDGAIVAALRARGVDCVDAIEIDEDRAAKVRAISGDVDVLCADALAPEAVGIWKAPHGLILTNPPFVLAMEFVELALASQRPHGGTSAFLLRLAWMASADRAEFHRKNPSDVYVLSKRPSFAASLKCKGGEADGVMLKACGWKVMQTLDAPRPKKCPACAIGDVSVTTNDSADYGWFCFGPGRGGRWSVL